MHICNLDDYFGFNDSVVRNQEIFDEVMRNRSLDAVVYDFGLSGERVR